MLHAEKVTISGPAPSYIYGNITFSNLEITTPGKEIHFEAGKTYTILGTFKVEGAIGENMVKLLSSEPGETWYIDPQGSRDITGCWVEDSHNLHPDKIMMTSSTNRDNSFNWDPPVEWDGDAGDLLWSSALNWDTDLVPGAG